MDFFICLFLYCFQQQTFVEWIKWMIFISWQILLLTSESNGWFLFLLKFNFCRVNQMDGFYLFSNSTFVVWIKTHGFFILLFLIFNFCCVNQSIGLFLFFSLVFFVCHVKLLSCESNRHGWVLFCLCVFCCIQLLLCESNRWMTFIFSLFFMPYSTFVIWIQPMDDFYFFHCFLSHIQLLSFQSIPWMIIISVFVFCPVIFTMEIIFTCIWLRCIKNESE